MSRSIIASAKSAISELRTLLTTTTVAKNDIAAALNQAESERRALLSAALNRADLEAIILRDVAAQQSDALNNDELLAELAYSQSRGIANQIQGDAASSSPFTAAGFNQAVLDRLIFALGDPATILNRLKPVIDRIDFSGAGPALAERRVRLASLEKQISGLRNELAEIDDVLANSNPTVSTKQEPKAGERRELSPGRWARWDFMPHQQVGFWNYEDSPVVLKAAGNQPIQ